MATVMRLVDLLDELGRACEVGREAASKALDRAEDRSAGSVLAASVRMDRAALRVVEAEQAVANWIMTSRN